MPFDDRHALYLCEGGDVAQDGRGLRAQQRAEQLPELAHLLDALKAVQQPRISQQRIKTEN